jgi:hypothetical protein
VINEYARNNKYFAIAKDFRWHIDDFFDNTLPNIGDALNSRINDNFQTFNFASRGSMGIDKKSRQPDSSIYSF